LLDPVPAAVQVKDPLVPERALAAALGLNLGLVPVPVELYPFAATSLEVQETVPVSPIPNALLESIPEIVIVPVEAKIVPLAVALVVLLAPSRWPDITTLQDPLLVERGKLLTVTVTDPLLSVAEEGLTEQLLVELLQLVPPFQPVLLKVTVSLLAVTFCDPLAALPIEREKLAISLKN
jgi:hypothetical protein